jgi:hypothetical protein
LPAAALQPRETFEAHLDVWTREVADIRIHGTTGEVPIARFTRAEAKALKPISGIPPFRATRELIRRVGSDCTVEIDGNAYWVIDPADYAGVAGTNGRYAATPPPACMPATAPVSLVRDLGEYEALLGGGF